MFYLINEMVENVNACDKFRLYIGHEFPFHNKSVRMISSCLQYFQADLIN